MIKLIILILAFFIPFELFAQADSGKCPTAMVNWNFEKDLISKSLNDSYLVIASREAIKIYKKSAKDYVYISDIKNEGHFPAHIVVTESKKVIFIGDSFTRTQTDRIRIFDIEGKRIKTISALDVLTKAQVSEAVKLYEKIDACTPEKPWICWEEEPFSFIEEEEVVEGDPQGLVMHDVFGARVSIDVDTGKIIRKPSSSKCSVFP